MTGRGRPGGCVARGWVLALTLLLGLAGEVEAAVTPRDVEVAMRTLGFVQDPPSGRIELAIIHAPDDPASVRDAETIVQTLQEGLDLSGLTIVPKLVPVDRLVDLDGQRFAFLAGDLEAHAEAIFQATSARGILSITTDPACVRAGRCVMAVTSHPRVEVIVSRTASAQSEIEFAPAFRLLIIEL